MSAAALLCSPAEDLQDDLLQEAFLRLPPEPGHLLVASLVCRRWRRLVRDPAFLRRFRAFHRTPPVLGFFQNLWYVSCRYNIDRRCVGFVPAVSSVGTLAPPEPDLMRWALDCRRGRVLLDSNGEQGLFVWDPIAGDVHRLSSPSGSRGWDVAAAVVCAAGHEDHTDCRSSPFRVIFLDGCLDQDDELLVSGYVYSSESGAWGDATAISTPSRVSSAPSALVGNSVYWNLRVSEDGTDHILEFEIPRQRLTLIELPEAVRDTYDSDIHVMPAEDGGIGFAGICNTSIHLWSRKIDCKGVAGWVLLRMIDMDKLTLSGVPTGDMLLRSSVVSFAEDSHELFLESQAGVFMINLRSMQLRKLLQARGSAICPYTSFYTRGCDIVGIDDRAKQ